MCCGVHWSLGIFPAEGGNDDGGRDDSGKYLFSSLELPAGFFDLSMEAKGCILSAYSRTTEQLETLLLMSASGQHNTAVLSSKNM